ncbi:UNVERIFIED_CONTAM: peptidoglycan -binding protein [Spiribacter pallidus]|jgi:chemotaxis protein MotB
MLGSPRRQRDTVNIWPGFVDALATILLAFVFVLLLFVVAQLYLSSQLSDRNEALASLQAELDAMAEALSLERDERRRLEEEVSGLYAELSATLAQRDEARESLAVSESALAAAREQVAAGEDDLRASLLEIATLQQKIIDLRSELAGAEARTRAAEETVEAREMRIQDLIAEVEERERALREEQTLTADAEARVEALRRQVRSLREQISALAEALRIEEQTVAEQRTRIDTLVERLNVALAEEVQELSSYRSEFFGRLREVLGDIEAIEIVGDRFRFQSELFFDTASAEIGPAGEARLAQVAETLRRVAQRIPEEIDWVLQVEGHTDRRPINTEQFPSNWQLSTARAQSILDSLIDEGIPPQRLAAVGYGEYQPVAEGDSPEALAQNRRIELRLSNR